MIEMTLVGVKVESAGNCVMLLKEIEGNRFLPIWIGQPEAKAILLGKEEIQSPRPLTHDLTLDIIKQFGKQLISVNITHSDDGIFYSELVFSDQSTLTSRPSDAIALAIRAKSPIYATELLLEESGVIVEEEVYDESELEKFKEFLDSVTPDDFRANGETEI